MKRGPRSGRRQAQPTAVGAPPPPPAPVREMDGWEFSFTCALPFQSLGLGNALSPFLAGPPKPLASWFFHLWAILSSYLWPGPSELLAPNTIEQRRWEVTSKITGRQKDLPPPCPLSLSFRACALGKATCCIGNSPVERPMWMSPTPSQQGPEARQQLLETARKQTLHPKSRLGACLTSHGLESC